MLPAKVAHAVVALVLAAVFVLTTAGTSFASDSQEIPAASAQTIELPANNYDVALVGHDSGSNNAATIGPEVAAPLSASDGDESDVGSVAYDYDDPGNLARVDTRLDGYRSAPQTAAGLGDDIVRFDPQWASRQLASQNLPGSTGWATTPGGRTLSVHAAERTFLGGPGRAPIDPALIDDILSQGTRIAYRGVNDTIRIGAPSLCGRCYVVVDAQNVNHIVTVMVPK